MYVRQGIAVEAILIFFVIGVGTPSVLAQTEDGPTLAIQVDGLLLFRGDSESFSSVAFSPFLAFELINKALLSRNFKPEWIKESERHEIKFTGPNGEACEFSASAVTRRNTRGDKEPFSVVVFHWRRNNFSTSNNVGEQVDRYTPARVLAAFEMKFLPWFR